MSGQNALPPPAVYVRTVLSVVQAPTWPAARRIVEANPYLVNALTDELLSSIALSARSQGVDQSATLVIQQYRQLFQRCLVTGVATAFSEFAYIPKARLHLPNGTVASPDDFL
jgi:hypothetical protein